MMSWYIVTSDQCHLEGEHIPKGWMLEFIVELPDELTEHVQQANTTEEVDAIRAELATNADVSREDDN